MKREKELADKIEELGGLFFGLNEQGKDSALAILEALDFAQSCRACGQDKDRKDETAWKNGF